MNPDAQTVHESRIPISACNGLFQIGSYALSWRSALWECSYQCARVTLSLMICERSAILKSDLAGKTLIKEGKMTPNMGNIDRIIRVVVALVVAVLIVTNVLSGVWAWIAGILAVVFLATSAIGFCPLYLPFRIKTR
jgi:small-conductance mechanosensitive channel